MDMEPTRNVRIEKGWQVLDFAFEIAEEAEAFARTAVEAYQPDDDKFSVSVRAVLAKDVTAGKEEEEE